MIHAPSGRFVIGAGNLADLNLKLSQILAYVTYLDSCSIGKTSDILHALDSITSLVLDARKICNKARLL